MHRVPPAASTEGRGGGREGETELGSEGVREEGREGGREGETELGSEGVREEGREGASGVGWRGQVKQGT